MKTICSLPALHAVLVSSALGLSVAASHGQVIADHDFSTGDRLTSNPPHSVPWYFYQNPDSTATLEAVPGAIKFSIPAADSWRPAGALIPFAEPGGVTLDVGQTLRVRFSVSQSNMAMGTNNQGMRWGVFNYGDTAETRPIGDDPEMGAFPGANVTGYGTSFSLHANSDNDMNWWFKRTDMENGSLVGSSGAFTWWDDISYDVGIEEGTQVFFADELYHIEFVLLRVYESTMHVRVIISEEDGTVVFASSALDDGLGGMDPFHTFDSVIFRAQVTGGTATGSVAGDPRAGIEEVLGTMSFTGFTVQVMDAEFWNDLPVEFDLQNRAWVDSPLLGFMMVEYAPWVWVESLQSWLYLPEHDAEGSWVFSPGVGQ